MKFRRKPVVVEAVRWEGGVANVNRIRAYFGGDDIGWDSVQDKIYLPARAGVMEASVGDWIVKGFAEGLGPHFWVVEAESFESFYEEAE